MKVNNKITFAYFLAMLIICCLIASDGFCLDMAGIIPGKIDISVCIEVEAALENNDVDDEDSSDITLATAEVGLQAALTDWLTGFVLFSWDDEEEEMIFDEAHITLGDIEAIPYYLRAGKLYVPFGVYESYMISDPLTLELGEIVDTALEMGIHLSGLRVSTYVFNGQSDEADDDDDIKCLGASVGYGFEFDNFLFDAGVDWINNILESNTLNELLEEKGLEDYVSGYAVHALFGMGSVSFMAEYVAVADDMEFVDGSKMDAPAAWAIEAGYTFEAIGKETTLALAYQGTEDAVGILPESKILASIGVGITDYLSAALEYTMAEDYGISDGGSGEDIDTLTLQLALEF